MARRYSPPLAPLEPNLFLYWSWKLDHVPGSTPITVEDNWLELQKIGSMVTLEEIRRSYVRIAARVRYLQRRGCSAAEALYPSDSTVEILNAATLRRAPIRIARLCRRLGVG